MISKSALLFWDGFKFRKHVAKDGKDLRPPEQNGKGNDGSEKITHRVSHGPPPERKGHMPESCEMRTSLLLTV